MYIRLEKISPAQNQYRFYSLTIAQTLFGEWAVIKEWGRLGAKSGQRRTEWFSSFEPALEALEAIKQQKERRGYVVCPEQLLLPL